MNTLDTYPNTRKKILSLWDKLTDDKKEIALRSLGLLFGEYQHLKTGTNRKQAYSGNPVFDSNMKVENLDFWADIQLNGYYPKLSQGQKETFVNAANEWYLKQFNKLGLPK